MAVDVAPPTASENKVVSTVRGIPSFYQAVVAEMKKVTWPERPDVQRATIAIIAFVLLLGLFIWLLDLVLAQVLVTLIPSLFSGS